MGSSLTKHGTPLDQERAASMADEGGVAGACMDTREQLAACRLSRSRDRFWSWLTLGALGAAIAGFVAFQLAHQRHA